MELLSGKPVSERIDRFVRSAVNEDEVALSSFLIGADPSSIIYSRSKLRKGESLGIDVRVRDYPPDVGECRLIEDLDRDASDEHVSGIMIERPLPGGLSLDRLMERVPPAKDVEGLHPVNYGKLGLGSFRFIPPTPLGALLMLRHYGIETSGKDILVIGRSPNVGRALAQLLSMKRPWANATVTLAHSGTGDLARWVGRSDIIITAAGRPALVRGDMVRDGTVIIDLGINSTGDGSIVGDVDIPSMEGVDVRVTPTPGGTGPVTVSSMFLNVAVARTRELYGKLPETDRMITEIYGG
ncbi:MAG TPA: bifunctional 5,10-methylenetetrahydrofolate dehydrogenase/5,10-methenyltetrahydrofolate cyclohydrolase [Euryarchaeota archaeon]|nr:MAG: bifunctional 5,10-methylene-tetrahydrofolate dehydrogenase/5,10-methylene-tetrahydrofolate cyclohydrolase [Thermoplasmatales archaeon ex4484_6]RLF69548.1 MAG: bifunctional 5,10-methylene-tetrahydrofolate dehydrogenase/5,10-methylene-tetrahydrofolate cyclohydrolase [Thermoplasmata archaeon]HHD15215.1 bifunctional 5,10-methylenetetrahydrofolate dehydrogenase/5,10-methenyltetrahydrofolate cyclohydrolase [Euryarchaeota archaeon]